jgi:hypothetical protein
MQGHVWPVEGTNQSGTTTTTLLYLQPLLLSIMDDLQMMKQIEIDDDYLLLRSNWRLPCLELIVLISKAAGSVVYRQNARTPGHDDGRRYKRYSIF